MQCPVCEKECGDGEMFDQEVVLSNHIWQEHWEHAKVKGHGDGKRCWCGAGVVTPSSHFRRHGGVLKHWLECGLGLVEASA